MIRDVSQREFLFYKKIFNLPNIVGSISQHEARNKNEDSKYKRNNKNCKSPRETYHFG